LDTTHPLSLTRRGPTDLHTTSNYYLNLTNSTGHVDGQIFLLDSGDSDCLGAQGWGCIWPDTVEWYSAHANPDVPSIGFYHIPLDEMMHLTYAGSQNEDVCCQSINTGLFSAMVEVGSMRFVSAGHDHNNDFVGTLENIMLAYGRKTGHGGYGPDDGQRGGRVIEFHTDGTVKTWIRQEDGSRVDQGPATQTGTQNTCCGAGKCVDYEAEFRRTKA